MQSSLFTKLKCSQVPALYLFNLVLIYLSQRELRLRKRKTILTRVSARWHPGGGNGLTGPVTICLNLGRTLGL